MSLRTRLTLIYGLLLALIFVGVGLGAEIVMQGRFSDQIRNSLTSAANRVEANYALTPVEPERVFRYALPQTVQPFADVYMELVNSDGSPVDESNNLRPEVLPLDPSALRRAFSHRQTTLQQTQWKGNLLEIYYTPMPRASPFFKLMRIERA